MQHTDVIKRTEGLLEDLCSLVSNVKSLNQYLGSFTMLKEDFNMPCVLAIAGKVKAGKSTFINSILGVDLAVTGITETTATVNIFKKGKPLSPTTPVLCKYTDGTKEWKSRDFLNRLQGTEESVLKLAESIDSLTFYIDDNPLLEDVTLVDTPGIGAAVGQDNMGHQMQTDAYFKLSNKLHNKHNRQTTDLSNSADAVLYLFKSTREELDKTFLLSLYDGGKGITSLNGVGVLSQVDTNESLLKDIPKFKQEYEQQLFTVIPTSAAVYKYLPIREDAEILAKRLKESFTDECWEFMSSCEEAFMMDEFPGCSMDLAEREALTNRFRNGKDLPWSAMVKICSVLRETTDIAASLDELTKFSGIEELKKLIHSHFFQRSKLLRCNKILLAVKSFINQICYSEEFYKTEMLAENLDACINSCSKIDAPYRNLIVSYLRENVPSLETWEVKKGKLLQLKNAAEEMLSVLNGINEEYNFYQKILQERSIFSDAEFTELCSLFSGQKVECVSIMERLQYWSFVANSSASNSFKSKVAYRAKQKYLLQIKQK